MSFAHEADPAALKVLYIDDNPLDLLSYSAALKQSSDAIDLRTATDLVQGIALLHEWDADVIVWIYPFQAVRGLRPFSCCGAVWLTFQWLFYLASTAKS